MAEAPIRIVGERAQPLSGGTKLGRPAQGLEDISNTPLRVSTNGSALKTLTDDEMQLFETISLERSIALGSVMTFVVRDPERLLMTKVIPFSKSQRSDILFDDLWFTCKHISKTVDEFTLEAEDREISRMRDYKEPHFHLSGKGYKNPRAVFIRDLVRRSGLHINGPHSQFFCPEINKPTLVIASTSHAAPKKPKGTAAAINPSGLKIEGTALDADQIKNVEVLLGACRKHTAPHLAEVAILCAAIGESTLHTDATTNSKGYWGVLQGGSGTRGSAPNFPHKPNYSVAAEMAESFLVGGRGFQGGGALALIKAGKSDPGEIATIVEASGEPAYFYGKHKAEAEAIVKAAGVGGLAPATTGSTEEQKLRSQQLFTFPKTGKEAGEEAEGAWECGHETAEEINWRMFCSSGKVWLASDEYLEKQPARKIEEGEPGVIDLKYEIDFYEGLNPPKLEVEARAHLWYDPPGTTIVVGERNGKELHEGVWLVSTINRRDITDNAVTITLERPRSTLVEPVAVASPKRKKKKNEINIVVPNVNSPASNTPDGGVNTGVRGGGENSTLWNVFFQMNYIAQHYPSYVTGGGHGSNFEPTRESDVFGVTLSPLGYDCSGAVSAVLGPAGVLPGGHPYSTDGLEFWGEHGTGKYMTVWVHPRRAPYADGHTFIEINVPTSVVASPPNWSHDQRYPTTWAYHGKGVHNGWDDPRHPSPHTDSPHWQARHWKGL